MHQQQEPTQDRYPHGRGYGHDYMRGGEVLGGYGYSDRDEYAMPRGDAKRRVDGSEGSGGDRDP
jgi:hypothetical protein